MNRNILVKKNDSGKVYAVVTLSEDNKKKKIYLHRIIANAPKGKIADHRDRDTMNNRGSNLRVCNHSENGQNVSVRADNTSGVRGVNFDKQTNKWKARVNIRGKEYHLGRFEKLEDAEKTVKKFRKEHMPFSEDDK